MFTILKTIFDTLFNFITFIINIVQSFIQFMANIPQFVFILISSFQLMPQVFLPFVTITISITVLLFLFGRNR